MRDYYEDLWERLPDDLDPPDVDLRRAFLLEHVLPDDRTLDLGCGEGDFTATLALAARAATGADVAEAALTRARRRHAGLSFDRVPFDGRLPYGDDAFDLIWASEVIEHVADTARFLSEVRRTLNAGGRLLVTTPNHARLRLVRHGIEAYSEPLGDHLHLYGRGSLQTVLAEFGFRTVTVTTAGGLPGLRRLLLAVAS